MSKRLLDKVNDFITVKGSAGKADLCKAIRKSEYTLDRWLKIGVPTANDAFNLAVGAGCSKEEALKLARECFPERAKETA